MKPSRQARKIANEKARRRLELERKRAMVAQRSEPTVPASPVSGTRLIADEEDDDPILGASNDFVPARLRGYDARPILARAAQLDEERALDWRIHHMLRQGVIGPKAVEVLRHCVTFFDFLSSKTCHWTKDLKRDLKFLRGQRLWDGSNHPTEFGEELWRLFRLRNRREGALNNILIGAIRRHSPLRRVA